MNNKQQDWVGNKTTAFAQMGARNFAKTDREEHDYYASPPQALEDLLQYEQFNNVLEPACGGGHLAEVLKKYLLLGRAIDLYDHGYGETGIDFFSISQWDGDIITNPPYRFAEQFARHALNIIPEGRKVAMLLKIQFLEGKRRQKMYRESPPTTIYVWPWRIFCSMNGVFKNIQHGSPMMFCWIVWQKGKHQEPIIRWFQDETPWIEFKKNAALTD